MRRFIALLLVSILLCSMSMAYAADYSSMTDEQLKDQFELIRNELVIRGFKAEKKTVIVEEANIQIYISDDIKLAKRYVWDTTYCLYIPIVVVNNSNYTINMIENESSVNGWTTDCDDDIGAVPAGKKAKGNLIFELEDTEVEELSDFTDAEFTVRVYDDNTWKDLFVTKPITIYANK